MLSICYKLYRGFSTKLVFKMVTLHKYHADNQIQQIFPQNFSDICTGFHPTEIFSWLICRYPQFAVSSKIAPVWLSSWYCFDANQHHRVSPGCVQTYGIIVITHSFVLNCIGFGMICKTPNSSTIISLM